MISKLKRLLPLLMLAVLVLALWSVYHRLHGYHWHDLLDGLHRIPFEQLGLALLLTLLSYLVMTGYDFLAVAPRQKRYPGSPARLSQSGRIGGKIRLNQHIKVFAAAMVNEHCLP